MCVLTAHCGLRLFAFSKGLVRLTVLFAIGMSSSVNVSVGPFYFLLGLVFFLVKF